VAVIVAPAEVTRATPKSVTFTRPSLVSMMFAGLMSRWMMPLVCA